MTFVDPPFLDYGEMRTSQHPSIMKPANVSTMQLNKEISDVFSCLRINTREAHSALEACFPFSRLLAKDICVTDYRCFLQVMLEVHTAVAEQLAACRENHYFSDWGEFVSEGKDLLERDMQDLRHKTKSPCQLYNSIGVNLSINSDEQRIAVLYVLLGSAMGSKVIYPHLKRSLRAGITEFYYLADRARWRGWDRFKRETIANVTSQNFSVALTVDAANKTFKAIEKSTVVIANNNDFGVVNSKIA